MDALFVLQFACCIITTMLMTILACSGFIARWRRSRYELSRWLLCVAMFLLTTHFILQMKHGLRASGDDLGAMFNILFYSPVAFLISFSMYNIECSKASRRLYVLCGAIDYALILAAFFAGRLVTGSMHIGSMLYVMLAFFVVGMVGSVAVNLRFILVRRRHVEEDTSMEMIVFDRFAWSSFVVISAITVTLPVVIFFRPVLFVLGPALLLALFVFVLSFISLGYDAKTIADVAEYDLPVEDEAGGFTDERIVQIDAALDRWCKMGGYKDSVASLATLSESISVPRKELTRYFKCSLNVTFRVWLSDIRFEKAKQMLKANKNYSIDAISADCGFVSHTQLYRLFKQNTGMSPGQWRDSVSCHQPEPCADGPSQ